MDAGKLDRRITLLQPVPRKTPSGQPVNDYQPLPPIWASVKQISGREQLRAGRELSGSEYSIWLRYHSTLANGWRVILDTGETLKVAALSSDRRGGKSTFVTEPI